MDNDGHLAALQPFIGREIGLGDWHLVTQRLVDGFAELTNDRQFIHVDPDRAAHGPYGATIAHGYLTLSLLEHLTGLQHDRTFAVPHRISINYGLDKVRFLAPVTIPSRIRLRTVLKSAEMKAEDVMHLRYGHTVEIEDCPKPALYAEAITRLLL